MSRIRLTARLRLTLIYGTLFFLAGAALLVINYSLVQQRLDQQFGNGAKFSMALNEDSGEEKGLTDSPELTLDAEEPITSDGQTFEAVITEFQGVIVDEALNSLLWQSAIALVITGLLAILLGWIVAGRVLRPVREITEAARRASETNLHSRVNLAGPRDEFKDLADAFDNMLERLEVAFQSQRHFAAQASHELRTPISIINAEADVALAATGATERERRLASSVQAAAIRGDRLITSLLALARSESTMLDQAPVDVAELLGDVVGDLVQKADEAGVRLDLSLADASVTGDRELLARLAINLIENAIVHNVQGGWVEVAVESEHGHVSIRVVNSGPQVAASDIASLFEPFKRQTAGRSDPPTGFGLGLAIVQSIVTSHDGAVVAEPRDEGGLEVIVTLPASRVETATSSTPQSRLWSRLRPLAGASRSTQAEADIPDEERYRGRAS